MIEPLQLDPTTQSGKTLWAAFRDASGNVWNGSAFVTYSSGALVAGAVAGSEQGATAFYAFTVPATVALLPYFVTAYLQSGGSPAATDKPVGSGGARTTNAVYVGGKLANIFGNAGQPCTITIDDPSAVPGAAVWITSDAAGLNTVAGVVFTDSAGKVTVLLVPGTTYYLWMEKAGENSINGQAIVAAAD